MTPSSGYAICPKASNAASHYKSLASRQNRSIMLPASDVDLPQRSSADARPWLFALAALIILFDRLSKLWIIANIRSGYGRVIIPHFFRLDHVYNTGAAFSIFADSLSPTAVRYSLVAFSLFAIAVVVFMLYRAGRAATPTGVALALILGGAIGNLYDRLVYLHVVDFLEFHVRNHYWPSFNVADSAIVTGACILLIELR